MLCLPYAGAADNGVSDMFFLSPADMPPTPVYEETAQLINTSRKSNALTFGVCHIIPSGNGVPNETVDLINSAYLNEFLSKDLRDRIATGAPYALSQQEWDWLDSWRNSFSATVTLAPKSGTVEHASYYYPNENYVGNDRVSARLDGKDQMGNPVSLTIINYIHVLKKNDWKEYTKIMSADDRSADNRKAVDGLITRYCPKGPDWQIK